MPLFPQTLTNPGAEAGSATGWTSRAGGAPVALTSAPTEGFGPHSGGWMFQAASGGATGSHATWDQEITIDASLFTAIDAGTATAYGAAWHRTLFSSDHDTGALYLECYDSGHSLLDSEANAQSEPNFAWSQEFVQMSIPANTRYIRIGTDNIKAIFGGGANDNYWDDFTLDIEDAPSAKAHQLGAYVLSSQPADQIHAGQLGTYVTAAAQTDSGNYQVYANQLGAYVLTRSTIRRRTMRAWSFSLDGHDFYVLNLAGEGTVIYDLATGQWSEWRSPEQLTWRAHIGCNWLGMAKDTADRLFGTNIVAGDDTEGVLWMLDPNQGLDDAAAEGDDALQFTRYVTGQVPMRMRGTQSCAAVYVTLSLGSPSITGAQITLRTSDDNGNTWYSHGSITVTAGSWDQEISWRGLGLMRSPGRLFELTDDGAAVRIAAADMKDSS